MVCTIPCRNPKSPPSSAEHRELPQAARELVGFANQRDGSDNISVQLIRIRDVERVGMYRGRPYKLR